MAQESIGIYLGRNFVDVVRLSGTLKKPKVVGSARVEIGPSGKSELSGASPEDNILNAIEQAVKESGFKKGTVTTCVSGEAVMMRYFKMIRIPKAEWANAVSFEAKKYIPFDAKDVLTNYQILDEKSKDKDMRVIFVACKRSIILDQIELLNKVKLKISCIEVAPFSLVRALGLDKVVLTETGEEEEGVDVGQGICSLSVS